MAFPLDIDSGALVFLPGHLGIQESHLNHLILNTPISRTAEPELHTIGS